MDNFKFTVKSLEDTKKLAVTFASLINTEGLFVTLTGDIGAGKTQFIRYVLEYLDVKDKVTSPSFVILNEYKTNKFGKELPIYHFDLYRLEEKGLKSVVDELREYSKKGCLTFIEWAEFGLDEIPKSALKINVEYDEENIDIRSFTFSAQDNFNLDFIKKLKSALA